MQEHVHPWFRPVESCCEEQPEPTQRGTEVDEVAGLERRRRCLGEPGIGEPPRRESRTGEEVREPPVDGELLLDGQRSGTHHEEPRPDERPVPVDGPLDCIAGLPAGGRHRGDGPSLCQAAEQVHGRLEPGGQEQRHLELQHRLLGPAEMERPAEGVEVDTEPSGGPTHPLGPSLGDFPKRGKVAGGRGLAPRTRLGPPGKLGPEEVTPPGDRVAVAVGPRAEPRPDQEVAGVGLEDLGHARLRVGPRRAVAAPRQGFAVAPRGPFRSEAHVEWSLSTPTLEGRRT